MEEAPVAEWLQAAGHEGAVAPSAAGATVVKRPTRGQEVALYELMLRANEGEELALLRPFTPTPISCTYHFACDDGSEIHKTNNNVAGDYDDDDGGNRGGDGTAAAGCGCVSAKFPLSHVPIGLLLASSAAPLQPADVFEVPTTSATTSGGEWSIELERIGASMRRPCVADIKIGACRVTKRMSAEKVKLVAAKEDGTIVTSHALRSCGIYYYDNSNNNCERLQDEVEEEDGSRSGGGAPRRMFLGKDFGRSATIGELAATFQRKFCGGDGRRVERYRQKLSQLCDVVDGGLLEKYAFVSTSVLLMHDDDDTSSSSSSEGGGGEVEVEVRLIDFAQSGPRDETCVHYDEGTVRFAEGLRNLMACFSMTVYSPPPFFFVW